MNNVLNYLITIMMILAANYSSAHGGVSLLDDETCIISIGFLNAHFTGYQPTESGTEEFCEDIPKVSESVFVIDYLHDFLKQTPVDFRIIKDTSNLGFFAKWEDLQKMEDHTIDTVFYQPPSVEKEGIYTVNYQFTEPGMYIGIVTATNTDDGKTFRAVFPFEVGGKNWGYLPFFIILIFIAQGAYWYFNKNNYFNNYFNNYL